MNEVLPVDRWRRLYVIPFDEASRRLLHDAARKQGWKVRKVSRIGDHEFLRETFYVDASADKYADVIFHLVEVRGGWQGWWTEPAEDGVVFMRFFEESTDAELEEDFGRVLVGAYANPERVRQLKRNLLS